jgi:hypothetical protein
MPSGFDFMDVTLEQLFELRNYLFPASFSSVSSFVDFFRARNDLFLSSLFCFFSLSSYLYFSPFNSVFTLTFPLPTSLLPRSIYLLSFVLADFILFISSLTSYFPPSSLYFLLHSSFIYPFLLDPSLLLSFSLPFASF